MSRLAATGVVVALGLSAAVLAQQTTPVFRSGVDLVHLDVSVLDRDRRPVKGLGPVDFTILEDGIPQKIAAFSAVDVPPVDAPTSAWMRDVPRDVRTNQDIAERRLFVLVVDDAQLQADPSSLKRLHEAARRVIDGLGPTDLASVIFTFDNRNAQDFTSDRARLLAAVNKAELGARDMTGGMNRMFARMSVDVLQHSVDALGALPDRRKVIIYLGQGVPVSLEGAAAPVWAGLNAVAGAADGAAQMRHLMYLMDETFKKAAKANVNIYPLDVCGLRPLPPPGMRFPTCVPGLEVDYLQNLAASTGGRSATNTNDLSSAFNVDGKSFGAKRMDVTVTLRAEASGMGEYELLSRMDLKPGRYQLRVALNVASLATSGSLYYDVDVPDFTKAPVSFSGMVLAARPSAPVTPKDGLPGVVPVTPTTRRTFSASDRVVAFTKVYQGGSKPVAGVPLRVQLRNQDDFLLMNRQEQLSAEMFTKDRSADINIGLPLERMAPGAYLLTLESTLDNTSAKREVRFDVVR